MDQKKFSKKRLKFLGKDELNLATRRQLAKITKDIKAGKNLSPAFNNARDAIAYLKFR